jgi:hypothetical protein
LLIFDDTTEWLLMQSYLWCCICFDGISYLCTTHVELCVKLLPYSVILSLISIITWKIELDIVELLPYRNICQFCSLVNLELLPYQNYIYQTRQGMYLQRAIWIGTTTEDTLLGVRLLFSKRYPRITAHLLVLMPPN